MKFELDQYNRNAPDVDVINDIRRVASSLGKESLTQIEYDNHGRFSYKVAVKRFGNWPNACVMAGLKMTTTLANRPDEELFKNLEEIWIRLGRQPKYGEILKPFSKFHVSTYDKRFGGWRKALEAFVSYINDVNDSPSEDLNEYSNGYEKPRQRGTRNINWRLRFIVMRRDNFKCKACGKSPATDTTITLDVDHIQAWSKGGSTVLENLQTLCTKCNIGKSNLEFTVINEVQNG